MRNKERCVGYLSKDEVYFLKEKKDFDTLVSAQNSMMPMRRGESSRRK
jgi:hypothetical protein